MFNLSDFRNFVSDLREINNIISVDVGAPQSRVDSVRLVIVGFSSFQTTSHIRWNIQSNSLRTQTQNGELVQIIRSTTITAFKADVNMNTMAAHNSDAPRSARTRKPR